MTARPSLSPSQSDERFSWNNSGRNGRPPASPHGSNEKFSLNSSRNPLSLRLYKSLSSNFQDAASREALETLSSLYGSSPHPGSGPRTTRDDEDANSSSDEDVGPEASVSASGFARSFTETTPLGDITIAEKARKNSRRDVEQQLIGSSIRFLHAFGDVNKVCTFYSYTA